MGVEIHAPILLWMCDHIVYELGNAVKTKELMILTVVKTEGIRLSPVPCLNIKYGKPPPLIATPQRFQRFPHCYLTL